jgi:glycosyltransferase involved in cell wall biosynthesis
MRIAYTTYWKANEIRHWSGTVYNIAEALRNQNIDIDFIDDLQSPIDKLYKIKSLFVRKILRKNYQRFREPGIIKNIAGKIEEKLKTSDADIIFSCGSLEISLVKKDRPLVFWSDAVFAGLHNYHPEYKNLPKSNIKYGNMLEQYALEKADLVLLSSDWAAKTAVDNYNFDYSKIAVVPFGANIVTGFTISDIEQKISNRNNDKLVILFVGVDWYKKGGDILLDSVRILHKMGIKTELHIVGSVPPYTISDIENLHLHGFISKSTPEGKRKIKELYLNANLFILPTRAEAYGIVFCEANAYGLPVIAPDIGGIPTIIKDSVNGFLVNTHNISQNIAQKAALLFEDKELYKKMSLSAFNEYKTRLNWDVSGKKAVKLLENLL